MNDTPSNIVYYLIAKTIIIGIVVLSCFSAGLYMAIHNIGGWGWFLFIGLICCSGFPSWSSGGEEDDDKEESE